MVDKQNIRPRQSASLQENEEMKKFDREGKPLWLLPTENEVLADESG
jgi:hypothetical protein